jgi:nickel-dependent lactate racemase
MSQPSTQNSIDRTPPYGATDLDLPSNWHVHVAEPGPIFPLQNPAVSVMEALRDPLGTPPLQELVRPGDQICIAFTHPNTASPEHILVPALLRELEIAGVADQDITLLCATSLYGRTGYDDKIAHLGSEVVDRYRVVDHDVGEVIHLGQWRSIPLTVNRCALEADLVISTGVVAPHLYAGYSGGADTLAVGCAGDSTIEAIHTPNFLYNPQVRPGLVRGNPFQEAIQWTIPRIGLRFILNVVLDPWGSILDVQAGDPTLVHQHLVFSASSLFNVPVPQTYDVVVANLAPPFGKDLYQAILGALFVGLAPDPVVRPGGTIIVPARTPEAYGQSINAQNFFTTLQSFHTPATLISELLEHGYRPGEARAFQLARLLEQHEVIVVGSEFPALVEACHLQEAATMHEAADLTRFLVGDDLDVLIIPHALHTLPLTPASEPDGWLRISLTDRQIW